MRKLSKYKATTNYREWRSAIRNGDQPENDPRAVRKAAQETRRPTVLSAVGHDRRPSHPRWLKEFLCCSYSY